MWSALARFPIPPRLHAAVYRATRGVIGGHFPLLGMDILLLTTKGRVTGKPRTTPLIFFREEGCLIVVASNRGAKWYPSWYWNLHYTPEAKVQIGGKSHGIIAREARPADYAALWPSLKEMLPAFGLYEERTPRLLPVMLLRIAP